MNSDQVRQSQIAWWAPLDEPHCLVQVVRVLDEHLRDHDCIVRGVTPEGLKSTGNGLLAEAHELELRAEPEDATRYLARLLLEAE